MARIEKIDSILMRELSMIISQELNDPLLGFPTVTECDVAPDYSSAKVYVSFLGKNYKKRDGLEALKRSKGHIKSLLAKRVRMRRIPDLEFIVDDSLDKADRIESIINENIKDNKLKEVTGGEPEEFDWRTKGYITPIKQKEDDGRWNFEELGENYVKPKNKIMDK